MSLDPVSPYTNPSYDDEGWQDLLDEDYDNKDGWTWTFYEDYEGRKPHQGWKIHVSAAPEDGREVADTVLPYLQKNSIHHKITDNPQRLRNYDHGRKNKLITVYPNFDQDKKSEITVELSNGDNTQAFHCFRESSRNFNMKSIDSNIENTSRIMTDLADLLYERQQVLGPQIPGFNEEELQMEDTRIHCRYTTFNGDGVIMEDGEVSEIAKGGENEMVGPEGEIITDEYYTDALTEIATKPFNLNWIEQTLYTK